MTRRVLRLLVPFAISAVLLILVINSVRGDAGEFASALGEANWALIVPAIGLYFVGIWLRSIRWGLLLPEHVVKTSTLFRVLVVAFTVNNLLPLRVGEVARAYLLARWCRIPYGTTLASLVVDRVLDGLALAVLLLLALPLVPSPPGYLVAVGIIAGAGFLAGAVVLAMAAWRTSLVIGLAHVVARFLPERIGGPMERLAANFARALTLVHSPGRLARLLSLSLLAWGAEMGVFYVLMLGFGIPGGYPLALLIGSASNFATLLPSSPGYAGTFDGVLIRVLQDSAGVATGLATAYDVVVHMTLFLPVVAVGMLVLWRSHVTFTQITHAPDRSSAATASGDWQQAA